MTTRSLTEVFILMRNNAIRNRNTYADNNEDTAERMQLISLADVEQGLEHQNQISQPPPWTAQFEDAQFTISKLKNKINELKALHLRHLNRPAFDESAEDEVLIENCIAEISSIFNSVHRSMQIIKSYISEGTPKERRLTANVVRSLATSLQELSVQYRATQNSYIRQIQGREERSKIYFDNPSLDYDEVLSPDEIDDYFLKSKIVTQQQLLYLEEENSRMALQREQEVNAVVKSILDLNDIFKDLSQMVADQGTILDRIDYNIEQSQVQVMEGFKQLQKADAYQRKNRKMCAILTLAATSILLLFVLIIVKT